MRLALFFLTSFFVFVSFNTYAQDQDLMIETYKEVFEKVFNHVEIERHERKLVTEVVFSYLNEPTKEKELLLKEALFFNKRLQSSPLAGIEDGIMDHVRRVTKSLGIIDDFGAPVVELLKSIEQGVVQNIVDHGPEAISAKDLSNISTVVYKLALGEISNQAQSKPNTAIMISESDKSKLLSYLFSLDLLRLSEESSSYLYEIALANSMKSFTELSRQVQGLRFTFWGAFALSDWAYPLSLGHRRLKDTKRYMRLLRHMIEGTDPNASRLKKLRNVFKKRELNIFRSEWRKSFKWMRRTLKIKQLTSNNRPLTTILSSGIMLTEIKLGILYAKFNTATLTLNLIVENGGFFSKRFAKWVILPMLRAAAKAPAKTMSGVLRVIHKTLSIGDKQIELIMKGAKKGFNFCGYHLKSWSRAFAENVY